MNNDFVGNELHKARRHDLIREAEGSWRLKAAKRGGQSMGTWWLKALGVLIGLLLLAQSLAR